VKQAQPAKLATNTAIVRTKSMRSRSVRLRLRI
jgi:hypothetical protein